MKLIIDRSRWARGDNGNGTYLSSPHNDKMCCLGFLGKACGIRKIKGQESPEMVSSTKWPKWLVRNGENVNISTNTVACSRLMEVNDNSYILELVREKKLTKEFAKHGIEVKFVDKITKKHKKAK